MDDSAQFVVERSYVQDLIAKRGLGQPEDFDLDSLTSDLIDTYGDPLMVNLPDEDFPPFAAKYKDLGADDMDNLRQTGRDEFN